MKDRTIRVRVAPSPTGDPHVGLAYMTLFNYVLARQSGGKLILRIEDTDQSRAKASSEELIIDSLRWLGLEWDEGPDVGGDFGPYRQSERGDIYRKYANVLIESGAAYRCFCSQQRLAELRAEQRAKGLRMGYDGHCRSMAPGDVAARISSGAMHVIRLATPEAGKTSFSDILRGDLEFDNGQLDDQVLIKSDGLPTYHLANVVDDHLMEITHVIRAEEWISSTPKHVILYEALGWEKPSFIHLPLLRNADRSKISKRKNPISLNFYRKKGILPKAMLNFLGLMGWSYSADQEIFSLDDMLAKFTVKDIHLGGPVFDLQKLLWINQVYIQKMSQEDFVEHLRDEVFSPRYLARVYPLLRERIESFEQFVSKADFFFCDPKPPVLEKVCPKTKSQDEMTAVLAALLEELDDLYIWEMVHLQEIIDTSRKKADWKPREYLPMLRLIVTGRLDSPPLSKTMEVIGREMVRSRIRNWLRENS